MLIRKCWSGQEQMRTILIGKNADQENANQENADQENTDQGISDEENADQA